MLVKAKWNVKDSTGWHKCGEVFDTVEDLGDAVEVLEMPKRQAPVKAADAAPEQEPANTGDETGAAKAPEKPRNSRRKNK